MRRRLLWSTLAAVGVAILLLGLPLAIVLRVLLTQQALAGLQEEAERAQVLLNSQTVDPQVGAALLTTLAEDSGGRFVLFQQGGPFDGVTIDTGGPPEIPISVARRLAAAEADEVVRLADEGVLLASVPLRVGGVRQLLVAVRDDAELVAQVRGAWFAIAALAVVAVGAAALVALGLGRRLARPLEALSASARRLGDGDFTARAPRSGLPEADDVATALDTTATRLAGMLERSRSFGADASHQLRTPLTALRLDLEALEVSGADPDLMTAAHTEADRLEATIEELLTLAAAPAGEEVVDVGRLVAERLGAWEALARAQGRRVVVDADPAPAVRVRAAALGQCLQVLLDNALAHGTGTITVSVRRLGVTGDGASADGAGRAEQWVRLCVGDEGPGVSPAQAAELRGVEGRGADVGGSAAVEGVEGRGRGLALARSLVEAEGGRLHLERARPGAVFCVVLPAVRGAVPAPPP